MNRTCAGFYFEQDYQFYWWCLMDGTITKIPEGIVMPDACPNCQRPITGELVKVETRVVITKEIRRAGGQNWLPFKRVVY